MEQYNIFGIIRTIIFSLIIVFGLWIWVDTGCPRNDLGGLGCIGGMLFVSVGGLFLIISTISWLAKARRGY